MENWYQPRVSKLKIKKNINFEKGQVILILILVMTVGLGIGLSMVQKSLVDVSTATKVEQSSRAFSAAEAGIEKALQGDNSTNFTSTVSKITGIQGTTQLPETVDSGYRQQPLLIPLLNKEDVVQIWLADYASTSNPPPSGYSQPTLEIYWGDSATDKPALEVTLIYYSNSSYQSRKWYLDSSSSRGNSNNFEVVDCTGGYQIETSTLMCKKTLGDNSGINNGSLPTGGSNTLIALRARMLYNSGSQPFAVWATGGCGTACNIPPQAKQITSTGAAGDAQRRVNLFRLSNSVPPYFDYAIFSAGEINK